MTITKTIVRSELYIVEVFENMVDVLNMEEVEDVEEEGELKDMEDVDNGDIHTTKNIQERVSLS
jgi:hypothetical protein